MRRPLGPFVWRELEPPQKFLISGVVFDLRCCQTSFHVFVKLRVLAVEVGSSLAVEVGSSLAAKYVIEGDGRVGKDGCCNVTFLNVIPVCDIPC